MKYKLLALDVDGTVVEADDVVRPQTSRAVRSAQAAGMRVCLATGRNLDEVMPIWGQLALSPPFEPIALIGGAMIAEPHSGRTVYQKAIPRGLAVAVADEINRAGYCAMAFVDRWRYGLDYYVTHTGDWAEADRMWFSKMDVRLRKVERFTDTPDMPRALRVSTVAEPAAADALAQRLRECFNGQLTVNSILAPNYGVMMVEVHARGADKLTALKYIAQPRRIARSEIVAVGDDVNDVPMVGGVGLGVAMGGAIDAVKRAADHVADGTLAAFIDELLAGRFDDHRCNRSRSRPL